MSFNLSEAKRSKAKLRLAIDGPSGSGKTYSALLIAYGICGDWSKIAVIDTERESANLYEDICGGGKKYLTGQINAPFTPQKYLEALHECENAGVEVVIIDSLTHAWTAEGGLLDIHAEAVKRQRTANSYTAWGDVTPLHRKLVDAILTSPLHVICTVRSDTEYSQEKDASGKTVIKKVGMKPQFRKGLDYEMTIVFSLDQAHQATVSKSRISTFPVNDVIQPCAETGKKLSEWLNSGSDIPTCSDCGKEIQAYGNMSAVQVALYTQRKYGRSVCTECGSKLKEINYGETSEYEEPRDVL
ncbi:MAG: AAA family ATPase [Clostridia bacterium]|nr:AAA family ATPase [Clostridia bacterium]